jgi:hypothetical protein
VEYAVCFVLQDVSFSNELITYARFYFNGAGEEGDGAGEQTELVMKAIRVPSGTSVTYSFISGATPLAQYEFAVASADYQYGGWFVGDELEAFVQTIHDDAGWATGDELCLVISSADTESTAWFYISTEDSFSTTALNWEETTYRDVELELPLPSCSSTAWAHSSIDVLNVPAAADSGYYYSPSAFSAAGQGQLGYVSNAYNFFIRFDGVDIAQGVQIEEARLKLHVATNDIPSGIKVNIYVVQEDDAAAPTSYADVSTREKGDAVAWDVPTTKVYEGSDSHYILSANVASLVQDILDRPGWVAGNSILFLLEDNGTPAVTFTSCSVHGNYMSGLYVSRLVLAYSLNESVLPSLSAEATGAWTGNCSDIILPQIDCDGVTNILSNADLTFPAVRIWDSSAEVVPPPHGDAALALPRFGMQGEAGPNATGTVSLPTMAAQAQAAARASISLTLLAATSAATLSTPATGDVSLPVFAISGGSGAAGVASVPAATMSAFGGQGTHSYIELPLPLATSAALTGALATAGLALPALTLTAKDKAVVHATAANTLVKLQASAAGKPGGVGSASLAIPMECLGVAFENPGCVAAMTVPPFTAYAAGRAAGRFDDLVLRYNKGAVR